MMPTFVCDDCKRERSIHAESAKEPGVCVECYWTRHANEPKPEPPSFPKCKFCGSTTHPVNEWGDCSMCVYGMARTNGD